MRGSRPGKTVQMTEAEVRGLCLKSRELFLQQPILLELEAPLKICGEYRLRTNDIYEGKQRVVEIKFNASDNVLSTTSNLLKTYLNYVIDKNVLGLNCFHQSLPCVGGG